MNYYVGNPLQTRGAEQYTLRGGKGDGMHFLYLRNGIGLEVWISLDRAGDISRVLYQGANMGYFSPCGYVAPSFYDHQGAGFLKSFTAGFFTTCGLTAVGSPCTDEGEELPLHGTISHIPATLLGMEETKDGLTISLEIRDCTIFGRKLVLRRTYTLSYMENKIKVRDEVTNLADVASPYLLLYHCNMGYPLLTEQAEVFIPNNGITPRNDHAAEYLDSALIMEEPRAGYEECCYYYDVKETNGQARVGIFNPAIQKGVTLSYKKEQLPCFTQWKMMGKTDYVLGIEPGNCTPDGRDVLRRNNILRFLNHEETDMAELNYRFWDNLNSINGEF